MDRNLAKILNLTEHKNIADSIPILDINEDGVIEVRPGFYSRTYRITDINFGIAKKDERGSIVEKWSKVLKAIDPQYEMQICIYKHSVNVNYLTEEVFLKGSNGIRKDIYMTLTIPAPDMITASTEFVSAEQDIIGNIASIPGCFATPLTALQRLNLIHDIYRGGEESEMSDSGTYNRTPVITYSLDHYYQMGVTANEIVQPASTEFRKEHFKLGEKFGRAFSLKNLSSYVDDEFVRDLTSLPFNMLFTIDLKQIETVKANELVRRQRTNASAAVIEAQMSAARNGYSADPIPDIIRKDDFFWGIASVFLFLLKIIPILNRFRGRNGFIGSTWTAPPRKKRDALVRGKFAVPDRFGAVMVSTVQRK